MAALCILAFLHCDFPATSSPPGTSAGFYDLLWMRWKGMCQCQPGAGGSAGFHWLSENPSISMGTKLGEPIVEGESRRPPQTSQLPAYWPADCNVWARPAKISRVQLSPAQPSSTPSRSTDFWAKEILAIVRHCIWGKDWVCLVCLTILIMKWLTIVYHLVVLIDSEK